jgi:hypothetical protein
VERQNDSYEQYIQIGYFLIAFSALMVASTFFILVYGHHFLPLSTGNYFLDLVVNDEFFVYFIPLWPNGVFTFMLFGWSYGKLFRMARE